VAIPKLVPFTLKIDPKDQRLVKMLCAKDDSIDYQYQLLDSAVAWAFEHRVSLVPIAPQRNGVSKSYYICESTELLMHLQSFWNCNTTRALHTALFHFLRARAAVVD
jgi:hypothetical protein